MQGLLGLAVCEVLRGVLLVAVYVAAFWRCSIGACGKPLPRRLDAALQFPRGVYAGLAV